MEEGDSRVADHSGRELDVVDAGDIECTGSMGLKISRLLDHFATGPGVENTIVEQPIQGFDVACQDRRLKLMLGGEKGLDYGI